ncbi:MULTISPECIES: methyltransferase family protein [Marinobacter]|uniref:Protein-S-isoprenylcysteine O-methyltransferase Ste14 n=1 Tax=Marinobacter segnicrescens TaxID=430453 RepID=A0A1I0FLL1_9GAMM|nr:MULTISPECIES: methyltransferase [Marinobacter]UZD65413.1 isoprenylcysteine carboxylmethyltransferase family protein [Marinobacter sp. AN1]SET59199.1 Protein-S-isoprenylcysteine O-methyltransferase Ste14 [Marinobacter segnicrescens]
MAVDLFTRHFLGSFFLLIGILFACRALGLYARLGFSHINYGKSGTATWWNRQLFNVFRAAILLVCLARMAWPIDPWLGVIGWLYQPPVLLTGVLVLLASFGLASYLQAYMHADWRSGIDREQKPVLITSGPYARTRNPLFLSVMLGQLGFFLALPSLFSLVCLLVGAWVIRRQALAEEAALAELYGEPYTHYRQQVPRWL